MNDLYLSLSLLARDWRAGEWRVLATAVVLAVGSIATVGLFGDRVHQALQQEAAGLLGADLRISSTRPLPPEYRGEALARGLRVVETASFPSMATGNGQSVLAEILAAGEGYPLRGKIEISDGGVTKVAEHVPARGTLWADARLSQRLGLQTHDRVGIGALPLSLAAQIARDVDRALSFASFTPRVIINLDDLPASGLVQNGSRINYRLLVAGDAARVADLHDWLEARLKVGEKLEDLSDARPEIRVALDRAEHFMGLCALTAATLAAVAIALAARRYHSRHLDACAMMRCMGAGQAQVLRIFLYPFLLLGLAAAALGCLIGYAAQSLLIEMLPVMRDANLPAPGVVPLLQALASGMALLLGFAFLPLWQLKSVPPLRVIRRELGTPDTGAALMYVVGAAVLGILFLWQAGSVKLGLTVLGGLTAGLLLAGSLAWLLLRLLSGLGVQAWTNLARHGKSNAVQIAALSLGGMALLLLTTVRGDLADSWQSHFPKDAPNYFIVNIQPDQRAAVQDFFARQQLPPPLLYPMVRGRLIAVNGRPVGGNDYADPRAKGLLERENNLSWSDALPAGNELVGDKSWLQKDSSNPALSVEEGFAKTLNLSIGDTLTFDVAGDKFSARIKNLRRLRWESMLVNFFVMTSPGLLDNFPASYITSFYLPMDRAQAGNDLIRAMPNLLLIDTSAMMEELNHIMEQIGQTMGAVFLFTLLGGVTVLIAALQATQDERIHQAALLSTLGADSRYLTRLHLAEFATLGAISGLLAATGAALTEWAVAFKVLDIPYHPQLSVWLLGVILGAAIVTLAGWLSTRHTTKVPPLQVLLNQ
jgi:putative ABC transport system permease protein